jgi:cytochrome P450
LCLQSFGEEFGRPGTDYRKACDAKELILADLSGRIAPAIEQYIAGDLKCTIVSSLLEAIEDRGENLDVERVVSQFALEIPLMVFAGTGTTAYAATTVVKYLCRFPNWLEHAYQEQKRIMQEHGPEIGGKVGLPLVLVQLHW